jgi:hypothetical protein
MMSGLQASIIVPPGQSQPFATITEVDHRAWIIIAAAMGVAFVSLTISFALTYQYSSDKVLVV